MRALASVPPHRVLYALALLAPVVLFAVLARSGWIAVGGLQQASAGDQLARAQDEVAALVRLDRVILGEMRARLPSAPAPLRRHEGLRRPLPWFSVAALPSGARRGGGIVALFVADAAGNLLSPGADRQTAGGTLQGMRLFARLQRGAPIAVGSVCPVATPAGLLAPGSGFVLAEPLDGHAGIPEVTPAHRVGAGRPGAGSSLAAVAGMPTEGIAGAGAPIRAVPATGGFFQGVIGACVAPQALIRTWRRRLGPSDTLLLTAAHGQELLRVAGGADDTWPGSAGARAAPVARTPLRVVFTAASSARWPAWYPVAWIAALLALTVGLALAAAARAAQHQQRTAQALDAAERFADVLRLSGERYRQLYLGAPAAMHALDAAWRIVAVNDRWLSLLGYRREDVMGRRFESYLAPAARIPAAQAWTRLLAGDHLPPTRLRMLRPDGTEVDVTVCQHAERDPDGRLHRALALLIEPTAVATAPDPGRPEVLARVAGGVAHDFNNLLMVVMGSLERLVAQADRPDTVRRLAGMALAAAERGAGLTARLLAAAGRQSLRPELVNANRLLREDADAITQAAGPKVDVQFLLSPLLDPARIDPVQFRATVLALVANAREAMPRGGRLTIETANLAGLTPLRGLIMISLSDTGSGMDAAVLARATEPFFTTRPPGKASGLGLSVAEGFARQSGGSLEIESEPGLGSTIRLLLPRSADQGSSSQEESARRNGPAEDRQSRPPGSAMPPSSPPHRAPPTRLSAWPTQDQRLS
jgi:PAS domain S-box-containing protein